MRWEFPGSDSIMSREDTISVRRRETTLNRNNILLQFVTAGYTIQSTGGEEPVAEHDELGVPA